jgi:hypothetical protein
MTENDFEQRLARLMRLQSESAVEPVDARKVAEFAIANAQRRRGPFHGLRRLLQMTVHSPSARRYGLTAAGVVLVLGVGAAFLAPRLITPAGGTGGSPSPQPSPTASPSHAFLGAFALTDESLATNLPAGNYILDLPDTRYRIHFALPEGWWHYWPEGTTATASDVHALIVNNGVDGAINHTRLRSAWGMAFTVVGYGRIRNDPCDSSAGSMDGGFSTNAESLAEAFSSWAEYPVESITDVVIAGYAGKRVELRREARCDLYGLGDTLFETPDGHEFTMQVPSSGPPVNQFTFLDVNGSVLVIWTTDYPGSTTYEEAHGASPDPQAHVEDQTALHAILDSIYITQR